MATRLTAGRWIDRIGYLVVIAGLTASCTDRATLNTVEIGGHRLAGQAITDAVGQTVGFAGIRYAQAPTGERRWRPPLPVDHEPGDYLHVFPPICPQDNGNIEWYQEVARAFGHDASVVQTRPEISEDCLFLNVWTPDLSGANPVMVWIHGGSNVNGYSYEPNYLGHRLAARGVVVSIQYRLGVFGFLAHPELSAESPHASSGNYALLDQLEALRWVRANIAAFGGDPGNVTVFGESAGAGNIAYLVAIAGAVAPRETKVGSQLQTTFEQIAGILELPKLHPRRGHQPYRRDICWMFLRMGPANVFGFGELTFVEVVGGIHQHGILHGIRQVLLVGVATALFITLAGK